MASNWVVSRGADGESQRGVVAQGRNPTVGRGVSELGPWGARLVRGVGAPARTGVGEGTTRGGERGGVSGRVWVRSGSGVITALAEQGSDLASMGAALEGASNRMLLW